MAVSESDIIAELTAGGARVEDHFLIGHEICAVNQNGELMSLLIEDVAGEKSGEMYYAIMDFLRRRGARVYQSYDEYKKMAIS
jgi:hypothetical protein